MLRLCGLVSETERSALAALCQQWSRYLDAQRRVRELGMVVKKPNGVPIHEPVPRHRGPRTVALPSTLDGARPDARAAVADVGAAGGESSNQSKWKGLL